MSRSHLLPQHELGWATGRESTSNMTNPLLDISLTNFGNERRRLGLPGS
jgi:hypothetical protein